MSFVQYRHEMVQIARELHYSVNVLQQLCAASTEKELDRIMCNARNSVH